MSIEAPSLTEYLAQQSKSGYPALKTQRRTEPKPEKPSQQNPKRADIRCGLARLVYDEKHGAWMIPGGGMTREKAKAEAVAEKVNAIISAGGERS